MRLGRFQIHRRNRQGTAFRRASTWWTPELNCPSAKQIASMPPRLYLRLAELLVPAILALALSAAWHAEHQARTQLAAELAAAKQSLDQASARQHDRDSQLLQTISALAAEKRITTTPTQILRDLPRELPLPPRSHCRTRPPQSQTRPRPQRHPPTRNPTASPRHRLRPSRQARSSRRKI
jgi:hypothetical protein